MKTAFQSDIGRHRTQNQDRVALFTNEQGLFLIVIADGIGGNRRGDLAAELTTGSFGQAFTTTSSMTPAEASKWLVSQVQLINNKILTKSTEKQSYHGMGTTLVAAVIFEDEVVVANI
ncbi:MAG TPA: protein phosphatase 2C domain-containing protein, partial [Candidatus Limosilactobacillus merdipullorum]|nr:protein phosphatase 2C domain-containing protein [Candidatus Limosilactobacillus merdipullorum]